MIRGLVLSLGMLTEGLLGVLVVQRVADVTHRVDRRQPHWRLLRLRASGYLAGSIGTLLTVGGTLYRVATDRPPPLGLLAVAYALMLAGALAALTMQGRLQR